MPKNKVIVRASDDGSGGIAFDVDGVKAEHARLRLDKDSGEHELTFELHDHSNRALAFDASDPIWVGEDCVCPPPKGIHSDQILGVTASGKSLELTNTNSGEPRELRYQLNFIAADGSPWACDPIIENGGGIKPPGINRGGTNG